MKKKIFLVILFVCVSFTVSAQGFYYDIGLGLGMAWTEIDGTDQGDYNKTQPGYDFEIGVDVSFKAGYAPFGNIPLYIVGEMGGIGHAIYGNSWFYLYCSYIIGPGVVFYPIPFIQLGASIGISSVINMKDEMFNIVERGSLGLAWNISAAVDLGKKNHSWLVGIKFFNAINKLETSKEDENALMISIFAKYAFRRKTQ